jgi:hypothetical protein
MSHRLRNLTALAVVVGSVCFAYWIQREVPSEKYRVRNPRAYSVCCPQDWSAEMDGPGDGEELGKARRLDGITMRPEAFNGIPPRMFVNRFASAPDAAALRADGWIDGSFQGQPALVREEKIKRGLTRGAVFERAGQWFEVIVGESVAGSIHTDQWWKFLETFRYPDGEPPTARPTATPTAAPTPAVPAAAPASTRPFQFPGLN